MSDDNTVIATKAAAEVIIDPTIPVKATRKPKNPYLNNKDLLAEVKVSKAAGKMSNKLAFMLQLLCAKYAKKGNWVNYCVDDQTTALTKRGWLSYDQITMEDTILSYDVQTGGLVWSHILDLYVNTKYDGDMHHLTTQGMDAFVTPNHKFVSVENGIKPVENIICNEHIVLMGDPVVAPTVSDFSDDFVQVVGWAVTEGHYIKHTKNKHRITISQKQGQKCDQIRECLNAACITYSENTRPTGIVTFLCSGRDIIDIHNTYAPNRVLSMDFILSLTQQQRLLLINTMVAGDGWTKPSGGLSYVQKCKDHTDSFLALCTVAGLTTSTQPMTCAAPPSGVNINGGTSDVYSINVYAEPKKYCKSESIDFHGGRQGPGGVRKDKPNVPTQKYTGVVWCPQTEFGTFIARRNKYIYVTGNTYNEDMQAYAMLMLVRTWNSFNPEKSDNPFAFFTQCIKHSFIQFLNQEKKHRTIRDLLLVDQGMNPSFNFEDRASGDGDSHFVDDEEDFHAHKQVADLLNEQAKEPDFEGDGGIGVDESTKPMDDFFTVS